MRFENMCGLSRSQLEGLVAGVARELAAREVDPRTLVSVGLYRSVAMVVALMRQNLTQHTAADIFGVSQATVSRRWNLLRDPIGDAVAGHVPDLGAYRSTVLVDGTLVPTWDWAHRDDLYSGKRHDHGFNLQIATSLDGDLLAVGVPGPGARHDAHAYIASGLAHTLDGAHVAADLGYVGLNLLTPNRRAAGHDLNDHDRSFNTQLSAIRAAVEHGISWLKNWKMLSHRYRGPIDKIESVIRTITNLHYYKFNTTP